MTGQEVMASHCSREGLYWVSGEEKIEERIVKPWKGLPREVLELPSPEVLGRHIDMALGDDVSGLAVLWLMVGLSDLRGLFQTSHFYDSISWFCKY